MCVCLFLQLLSTFRCTGTIKKKKREREKHVNCSLYCSIMKYYVSLVAAFHCKESGKRIGLTEAPAFLLIPGKLKQNHIPHFLPGEGKGWLCAETSRQAKHRARRGPVWGERRVQDEWEMEHMEKQSRGSLATSLFQQSEGTPSMEGVRKLVN